MTPTEALLEKFADDEETWKLYPNARCSGFDDKAACHRMRGLITDLWEIHARARAQLEEAAQ